MKKLFVAILAVLYLGVSSGATLHMHYCMGKLLGVSLVEKQSNKCGKCGMEKTAAPLSKCCKDEHKLVKLGDDHMVSAFVQLLQAPAIALPAPVYPVTAPETIITPVLHAYSHGPPYLGEIPLFIRHCVFRI